MDDILNNLENKYSLTDQTYLLKRFLISNESDKPKQIEEWI